MVKTDKYHWLKVTVLVCILLTLSSSSFLLSNYLTEQVSNKNISKQQLAYALKNKNQAALKLAWQQSKEYSESWLSLAKSLAKTHGQAAHQLAIFYQKKALMPQALIWYQQAIRLKYPPSYTALAKYYYHDEKSDESEHLLNDLIKLTLLDEKSAMEAQVLYFNLAIKRGDISAINKIFSNHVHLLEKYPLGKALLTDLKRYRVLAEHSNFDSPPLCERSIQLFATNFEHLNQAELIIKQFEEHPLSEFICFSPVRYMPVDALACNLESQISIQCDEKKWHQFANTINTRFVSVLLPEGGANVHYGVLYIDAKDNIDVLIHEVSHLLGFIDEYPLTKEHSACTNIQKESFSENIAVLANEYQGTQKEIRKQVLSQLAWGNHIKETTPILQAQHDEMATIQQQWLLGTPEEFKNEIGVYKAKTCVNANKVNGNMNAFRPISHATKLEYFNVDFPKEYMKFIAQENFTYMMPSFHYNIALAYFKNGNVEEARYWLKKSASWEKGIARKEKILQGNF